jgi:hypothetical protein
MCRNIKTLHHFEPPATPEEIRASALQFVRKLSGMAKPSKINEAAFEKAIRKVQAATEELFETLEVHGAPRDREVERMKAKTRGQQRESRMLAKLSTRAV